MLQSKDLFHFNDGPIENFLRLFEEHKKKSAIDPTVMTLSTVNKEGRPNGRTVLLKQVDRGDFVFFTNYESTKGKELNRHPFANLVFYWHELYVQVRVEGSISKTTREETEAYFKTRPRLSQLGALVSHQSETIESYEFLQKKFDMIAQQYEGQETIPCPKNWGGYRLHPQIIEFWFGVEGRLHQRYVYEKKQNDWSRSMKSP